MVAASCLTAGSLLLLAVLLYEGIACTVELLWEGPDDASGASDARFLLPMKCPQTNAISTPPAQIVRSSLKVLRVMGFGVNGKGCIEPLIGASVFMAAHGFADDDVFPSGLFFDVVAEVFFSAAEKYYENDFGPVDYDRFIGPHKRL